MPRSLRFPGESDDAFRARAERTADYAKLLVDGALGNECIRAFIADPTLPYSEDDQRRHPTVRIEYEEAIAIGAVGECLHATRHKHWGDGPYIHPLRPDDPVDPMFVLYIFRENSLYNRRFEQRKRLKELLGRDHRNLVQQAKYKRHGKKIFLSSLTDEQVQAIRRRIGVEPGLFWRACRGKLFLPLPPRQIQLELF